MSITKVGSSYNFIYNTKTGKLSLEFPYFYPHFSAFTGSAINNFQKITKI